ncbi:NAD-dependent epimerase/dehydratase family protein [Dyadobacter sp. 50-39]|uniref:NAD-dependent epimerase/dehydratase family protein n=1 Tax=Dyadobacter sp. 50-39 TaxID=1895756 RepID=UPI000AD78058|nr:NAD-dependent epimerase/dehydratase family protein [Dyadobacter sp. 50-39]
MEPTKTALIVGASGVIGKNLTNYLRSLPGWRVIGTSRKLLPGNVETVVVDLLDEADVVAQFAGLDTVTR